MHALFRSLGLSHFVVLIGIIASFLGAESAFAQSGSDNTGTGGRHTIQGRIYYPSGRRSDVRVKVKLESVNFGELSVFSDINGSFSFKGLESGSYTIVVDAGAEYEIARESVYIETEGGSARRGIVLPPVSRLYTVDISLQPKRESASSKSGVINAALSKVPQAARDLYLKALTSAQAGNSSQAIEQLKGAIANYPEFPLALNELGVQYLKQGHPDKAADEFESAVKFAPEDFEPRLHLGIALLNLRRYTDAEHELRTALSRNSSAPTVHMYLGISLAIQRKLEEGQRELELALASNSTETVLAHRYLAGIFLERSEKKRAADELETYLKLVPKAPDAAILQRKIKELRSDGPSKFASLTVN